MKKGEGIGEMKAFYWSEAALLIDQSIYTLTLTVSKTHSKSLQVLDKQQETDAGSFVTQKQIKTSSFSKLKNIVNVIQLLNWKRTKTVQKVVKMQ